MLTYWFTNHSAKTTMGHYLLVIGPPKGTFQKRFSGFCPLGGGGYPPIPLRKIPLKSRFFWSESSIFCLFSYNFREAFKNYLADFFR